MYMDHEEQIKDVEKALIKKGFSKKKIDELLKHR